MIKGLFNWSEMTLNYRVMVEGYPNLKEEVGCEIPSLLDIKLARWSIASYAWHWYVGLLSQKEKKGKKGLFNDK